MLWACLLGKKWVGGQGTPEVLLEPAVTPSVLPLKQLAKLCHEHHVFVVMHGME